MGPWASDVEVEDVAVFLGRELGVGRGGDEVAEFAGLAAELAVAVGVLVDRGLARVSCGFV